MENDFTLIEVELQLSILTDEWLASEQRVSPWEYKNYLDLYLQKQKLLNCETSIE